jgi:uncharacterized protein (DUF305 family)
MNKQNIIIGLLAVIVIILLGSFFTGRFNSNNGDYHMMGRSMSSNMDRNFIEQMIPHHEGAIAMAQVALEKSKRPEIQSLAKGIIEAQQKEINDMKGWYQNWFGTTVPVNNQSMMGGYGMNHMTSMNGDINALSGAKDFDLEFIRQMIPHHEMAIMMAQMLKNSTDRPEMKQLADNIITSQSREIEVMRSWQTAWSNQ